MAKRMKKTAEKDVPPVTEGPMLHYTLSENYESDDVACGETINDLYEMEDYLQRNYELNERTGR